jgi:hypothetical protein
VKNWVAAGLLLPVLAGAQGYRTEESSVGSEREAYERVRALAFGTWTPAVLVRTTTPGQPRVVVLRPSVATFANTGFAWRVAPVWTGRGATLWASTGAVANWRSVSLRVEPFVSVASNAAFELDGAVGFRDAMVRSGIDLPQRFGDEPFASVDLGESHATFSQFGVSAGFSSERLFWGPGVKHALVFSSNAPGFPRLFAGTSQPLKTPIGWIHGQLIYGRLSETEWAPVAPSAARLGTGFVAWWSPWSSWLSLGATRFYHREWPRTFELAHLLAPFGSFLFDEERFGGGATDNQLASLFGHLRIPEAHAELFGEFGRNDRNVDLRDLSLEPEHNSAWLLGAQKAFRIDSTAGVFWRARLESASGRVSPIQNLGREQATFYEHASITQGHTQRGLLLGTSLIERAGGAEAAVDRFDSRGRLGMQLLQRQMPSDLRVSQPEERQRTQWDLRFSGMRFVGKSEFTWQIGNVWDLNRFPGRDVTSLYLGTGWRFGF